ncbi:MAG: nucleotide sugar dehydrogenase [Rhizobiaceae bacterium]|nr:nucleotide sugar dehydrogenase [Rhizobiaceae bacterium]
MKISVFGLGYVGTVSAACLADSGHHVVGLDANAGKLELIAAGSSPIVEKDVDGMIASAVADGGLQVTGDVTEAVANTDLSLICVGTPSLPNGNIDLAHVKTVCAQIGAAIKAKGGLHVVAMRSTMLPGSMGDVVIPTLEQHSGLKAGQDFGVCINPEFLREGTAVFDYRNPPKTVIGESDTRAGDVLAELYVDLDAPLIRTGIETAELAKYVDNTWHALKVSFANEVGNISKSLGIDSHAVMDIFCQDTKLNLSSYYLKPGFAFGGSCLPKDVRALTYKAKSLDLDLPVLNSILPSNQRQVEKALNMVEGAGSRKIGVLGFAFKAGTDDLRESPVVELVERLLGKGYEIKLYDRNVTLSRLTGANRDFALRHVPHISALMVNSVDDVLEHAQTIIVGNKAEEFSGVLDRLRSGQTLVDLVRISDSTSGPQYDGICW